MSVTEQTLHTRLLEVAQRRGSHVALSCGPHEVTYADLARMSAATAGRLASLGVGPHDRVAYLARESVDYYALLYACALSGAVLVPINWRLAPAEVAHILADSGATCVVVDETTRSALEGAELHAGVTVIAMDDEHGLSTWSERGAEERPAVGWTGDRDHPVVQLYTSGTTGLPKGVVLAHRSFFAVADALASAGERWVDWRDDDVSLIGIPGFHIGGLWWATQGLNAGVTNVVVPVFVSSDVARSMRDHRVTTVCLVPAMLQMLLDEPLAEQGAFDTLRKVVYGGAPISGRVLERGLAVMGAEFAQIYGLTETGNTAVCLPPSQHVPGGPRLAAAGRPYPGFEVAVLGEDGRRLPPGEVGHVALRTPAAMLGYWRNARATEETLVDGWVMTGDAGRVDAEGYLFITDRIKDAIVVAGENVYPAEIEAVLNRHAAVREAAVVARPDERWGEAVHAVVVRERGHDPSARELSTWLGRELAAFKIPTSFEFLDVLPRNPSGKILRRSLRERFWADTDRGVN